MLASYTLCGGENGSYKQVQALYRFCRCQNAHFQQLHASCMIRVGRTEPTSFCKAPTHFVVLKVGSNGRILAAYHVFRWSKRSLPTTTNLLHALWWSKHNLPTSVTPYTLCGKNERTVGTTASLLHALQWSKRTLQTSASLLHGLSELLQACYPLYGCQNQTYELLQAFHTLCDCQNVPYELLKPSYMF